MKIYIIALLAIFGSLYSCSNAKELEPDEAPIPTEDILKGILVTNMNTFGSDPIAIQHVEIKKNLMMISVKYSGGCKEHEFELMGTKMISKSLPPQRAIKLFHQADNDDCREIIEETLIFDISAYAVGEGEVSLRLDGWEAPISYIPVL